MSIIKDMAINIDRFPKTRYQGSKRKIVNWIWDCVKFLDFEVVGDLLGGTAAVAYMFKQNEKSVIYNDILLSNYYTGLALIENTKDIIERVDLEIIFSDSKDKENKVKELFGGIYYTNEENEFIDNYIFNVQKYYTDKKYKKSLLLWCLFQACIIKRPFNLFHRSNLYIRTNNIKRSFGNKTSWDRPFSLYIKKFANEINNAITDKNKYYKSLNFDVFDIKHNFDLVYIDTPYIAKNGTSVDYMQFYHFLEGLCNYDNWERMIDFSKKHRPLRQRFNPWNSKDDILEAFNKIFSKFSKSHLVVSYRSDGMPTIPEILTLMKKYKKNVTLFSYGEYRYVLSHNGNSQEILIIGYD